MKHKVGDKVEYESLTWVVLKQEKQVSSSGIERINYWISRNGHSIYVSELNLNPYKSAHDKLIEMGYIGNGEQSQYIKDSSPETKLNLDFCRIYNKCTAQVIYKCRGYSMPINLELARVITQYLEEMEGAI